MPPDDIVLSGKSRICRIEPYGGISLNKLPIIKLTAILLLACGTCFGLQAHGHAVILSQNKCDYGELPTLDETMRNTAAPVINRLVDEGKLLNWGILSHAWGDEWNWNIYYVSRDIPTFLGTFQEYIQAVTQADPDFVETVWNRCFEHKDAMYQETMGYTSMGSGPKVKSMTLFNLPSGYSLSDVQESLDAANEDFHTIGYPANGYRLYNVNEETVTDMQVLVERTWTSQEIYDEIHSAEEWLEATNRFGEMWDLIMKDRTYRRFALYE